MLDGTDEQDDRAPSSDVFGDMTQPTTHASTPEALAIDTERDVLENATDWELPRPASRGTPPSSSAPPAEPVDETPALFFDMTESATADISSESLLSAYLAEEEYGAERLAPMSPEDAARSEFAVPDHASELLATGPSKARSHPTPDRVFTAHGMEDAALIETDSHPVPPPAEDANPSAGGGHANVYSDGTLAPDTAASWKDSIAVSPPADARYDAPAGTSPTAASTSTSDDASSGVGEGIADALERVAQRIRSGELRIAVEAGGASEAAALAAALSALLGVRR